MKWQSALIMVCFVCVLSRRFNFDATPDQKQQKLVKGDVLSGLE